jgi:hypothetical protein
MQELSGNLSKKCQDDRNHPYCPSPPCDLPAKFATIDKAQDGEGDPPWSKLFAG